MSNPKQPSHPSRQPNDVSTPFLPIKRVEKGIYGRFYAIEREICVGFRWFLGGWVLMLLDVYPDDFFPSSLYDLWKFVLISLLVENTMGRVIRTQRRSHAIVRLSSSYPPNTNFENNLSSSSNRTLITTNNPLVCVTSTLQNVMVTSAE